MKEMVPKLQDGYPNKFGSISYFDLTSICLIKMAERIMAGKRKREREERKKNYSYARASKRWSGGFMRLYIHHPINLIAKYCHRSIDQFQGVGEFCDLYWRFI